ncbi:DinB family protein [Enemella sp. A6]|uniref:DinB family protein n=1 Tax=Enemella sp. A6 TaxID=3440152 RepID=UPI003EB71AA5
MTRTVPGAEAAGTADERTLLLAFLAQHRRILRETVLKLTDEESRRRLVPSLTTPLGLLKHASFVETAWFVCRFGGQSRADAGIPETVDESFMLDPADDLQSLAHAHEAVTARADRVIESLSLDDSCVHPVMGELTLRWVSVHCIRELAQHAGHAEILVEQILSEREAALRG